MGAVHTVGPSEALVISGGCAGGQNVRTIIGGWGWAWSLVSQVQRISLGVMTLTPRCEKVETKQGVPLTVTGVAQVKIIRDTELLKTACQQFLGKSTHEIRDTILHTMEGHLRAILGTLTVETIYKDRDEFAKKVREIASPDVALLGMEILSFTIQDVVDNVEYLDSLGRAQTAIVKRDADIGVAQAERDAGVKESECSRQHMDVKYSADTKIANATREFELKKANFDKEINTARAQAELAYQLQAAKENQKIRTEEVNVSIVERRKQIELEEKEILCSEKKMDSTIRRPAEAEAFKMEQIAAGNRQARILRAQAEAERIRIIGQAKAAAIAAKGKAEAEQMKLRAEAYNKYGKAATLTMVLDSLPAIAAEVAAPLAKTTELVVVPNLDSAGSVTKLGQDLVTAAGTVPPALRALTGIDVSKVFGKIPGATTA